MTQFNVGDTVRYTGKEFRSDYGLHLTGRVGVIERVCEDGDNIRARFDGRDYGLIAGNLELENATLVSAARRLVGPKPTDEGPMFQAPFAYDGDDSITDARGRAVLQVAFDHDQFPGAGDAEMDAFGEYVAAALNARVEAS